MIMLNIAKRQHWIFDMDGTLTVGVHDFALIRAELGLAKNAPILETLSNLPAPQAGPLWQRLNELEFHFASLAKPMPGALELLDKLHQRGVKLGIITRNWHSVAQQTLTTCQLVDYFPNHYILDRDSCPPKPSPAGLQQLMQQWQATQHDTVMVGDYLYDLQAGKAAGVATIHLDTSSQFMWPEFTDWQVSSLHDIDLPN
jgi:HAD superfamily hydrolase (TIGR01509 family)